MGNENVKVQLPGNAVAASGDDVAAPAKSLLIEMRLLGTDEEIEKAGQFSAVFIGPPQSVAVIEAGATALVKAWAAGLGAAAIATWSSVVGFWSGQPTDIKQVFLWIGAIVSAALLLSIGLMVSSDVRGRAAASVATIEGRTAIGQQVLELAKDTYGAAHERIHHTSRRYAPRG